MHTIVASRGSEGPKASRLVLEVQTTEYHGGMNGVYLLPSGKDGASK
jgi:hypothetical protein